MVWNTVRVLVTLAGVYTVSRFTEPHLQFAPLLLCSIIAIVVMRLWMPGSMPEKENRHFDSFSPPEDLNEDLADSQKAPAE